MAGTLLIRSITMACLKVTKNAFEIEEPYKNQMAGVCLLSPKELIFHYLFSKGSILSFILQGNRYYYIDPTL